VNRNVTAVVIGGGHCGLAMSHCLASRSIDHVVLERGSVAHSWKTERWDSLRLLTPNWQSRLPGRPYAGDDPDGFMSVRDVVGFLESYASGTSAPLYGGTTVTSVRPTDDGYDVMTDQGPWRCRTVVLATGACNRAAVPDHAAAIPADIDQVTPISYRTPERLAPGGVLVVGASATGLQLADEIHRSGRPVTVSVGYHVRMPRTYRGRDIQFWMDATGLLDERFDEVDDIVRARKVPSPQLVGTPERTMLDLNRLTAAGVELRGRLGAVRDGVAMFSGGLRNTCHLADLKMHRLLDTIDEWATEQGIGRPPARDDLSPTEVHDVPLTLDLHDGSVSTVLWATGYRPDYSWLDVDVVDRRGRVRHHGGVVDAPGMYLLGTTFLRRRKSSFIHGAEDDCNDLADHMVGYLAGSATA